MEFHWWDPRRWPIVVLGAAGMILAFLMACVIASLGLRFYGSHAAFEAARQHLQPWFLVWRIILYVVIAGLWFKRYRPRLIAKLEQEGEQGIASVKKLSRSEWLMAAVVAVMEISNLIDWMGGHH